MNRFLSVDDAPDIHHLINKALACKANPLQSVGIGKTLAMIFLNPSLRTRMSTIKAAQNMGMQTIAMNINDEGWKIELEDGVVMDGNSQEHIRDAARVIGSYCDILGVRSFPTLKDRESDYSEYVLHAFVKDAGVPVISLESATRHPLQSLTDMMTIQELGIRKPRIAVSWAPHPRILPQAVTNSFLEWIRHLDAEVVLTYPEGYALKEEFSNGIPIVNNQNEALSGADIVYTKNWSSYEHYGTAPGVREDWTITSEKMKLTNKGKFMHCLPIRRNVVASDEVVDNALIYTQAANRVYAAQAVLNEIIESS